MGFGRTQSSIITLPSSWYEWNTVAKILKQQVVHPAITYIFAINLHSCIKWYIYVTLIMSFGIGKYLKTHTNGKSQVSIRIVAFSCLKSGFLSCLWLAEVRHRCCWQLQCHIWFRSVLWQCWQARHCLPQNSCDDKYTNVWLHSAK